MLREPGATVTGVDSVTAEAGFAVTVMAAPPAGAAAVNVAVQEEVAGDAIETGLHVNPLSPGWIVTEAPVVEVASTAPVAAAAAPAVSCKAEDESVV